jgi:hypothetical protein
MNNLGKAEIDLFKMEELRFLDLSISENMKKEYKLKTVKVRWKDNVNLSSGELKKNKSSKELKFNMKAQRPSGSVVTTWMLSEIKNSNKMSKKRIQKGWR